MEVGLVVRVRGVAFVAGKALARVLGGAILLSTALPFRGRSHQQHFSISPMVVVLPSKAQNSGLQTWLRSASDDLVKIRPFLAQNHPHSVATPTADVLLVEDPDFALQTVLERALFGLLAGYSSRRDQFYLACPVRALCTFVLARWGNFPRCFAASSVSSFGCYPWSYRIES